MSRLPSMPVLGPCGERGGILLGRGEYHVLGEGFARRRVKKLTLDPFWFAVRGAKVNLLQWRSTTTNVLVELPVYLDDRDALRQVEQVLVHIHGRGKLQLWLSFASWCTLDELTISVLLLDLSLESL